MAITDTDVELEFGGVVQGVPVVVGIQTSGVASEISVRYSTAKIDAVQGVDYTLTFPVDLSTFSMTPTLSLMNKITAAGLGNVIYVKRTLPYTSDFDYDNAFVREKLVDEFDRVWMSFQQIDYSLGDVLDASDAAAAAAASAAEAAASAAAAADSAADAIAVVSAMNYVENYGAVGDGVTDDSLAIQAAIDSNQPVRFMAKTYALALTQTMAIIGWSASPCALKMKSGMVLLGAGQGKTILKLKNGVGVNSNWNLMSGNAILDDVVIRDITFDLNGQNNSVSGNTLPANTAAIMCSGDLTNGSGVQARMNRARIVNCGFVNGPGMSCIVLGQSAVTPWGYNNIIEGCYFFNNGLSWTDHSSVFTRCDRSVVRDCWFSNTAAQIGTVGAVVAIEVHGSGNSIVNNTVNNYIQFAWVVSLPSGAGVATGNVFTGNRIEVSTLGIGVFTAGSLVGGILDLIIANNNIRITNDTLTHGGYSYRCAVALNTNNTGIGSYKRIKIIGNHMTCVNTSNNFGIIATSNANQTVQDLTIENNFIEGFSLGIYLQPDGTTPGGLISSTVRNNNIKNFVPTTAVPTQTAGITVTGGTFDFIITDNIVGSGANSPYYGINLIGTISDLHMEGNRVSASNTTIRDTITVTNRRTGQQARTFAALPAQSSWVVGDIAFNSAITVLAAGFGSTSKYTVPSWARITNGSGNVLDTDWVQNRALTGT